MRHTSVFVPLVLMLGLAACGTTSPIISESIDNSSPRDSKNLDSKDSIVDPVKVANYLFNAGFTKEDAERVKSNFNYISEAKNLNPQTSSNEIESQNARVIESMDLIINNSLTKNEISSQAVTRSLIVNAANNISLYSMDNFQYYQSQNYLAYSSPYNLDYRDDGCSAPDIFFVPNNVFYEACDQHDFGYRNGLFYELHNASFKQSVDVRLYNNSIILCDRYQPDYFANQSCKADSAAYYTAVVAPIVTYNWLALPSK